MGPWRHAIGQQPVGELTFRDAQPPPEYDAAPWFRHYLLGVDNGVEKLPAVSYYVMGDTHDPRAPGNQWRHAADWPPPSRPTPYYFASGGLLSPDKPTDENGAVAYTFDPADPCPTIGGNNLTIPAGPRNQNPIESRKDVVLFTSAAACPTAGSHRPCDVRRVPRFFGGRYRPLRAPLRRLPGRQEFQHGRRDVAVTVPQRL